MDDRFMSKPNEDKQIALSVGKIFVEKFGHW